MTDDYVYRLSHVKKGNRYDEQGLVALFTFVQKTLMQYGYKMLLLLVMFKADEGGSFSLEETVEVFDRFYCRRDELGLPLEKQRGDKRALLAHEAV